MGQANAYFYAKIGFYRQIYHLRKKIFAGASMAVREMLTQNREIWISAKNVLSLLCIGADRR